MENETPKLEDPRIRNRLGKKAVIVLLLALAVGAAAYMKNQRSPAAAPENGSGGGVTVAAQPGSTNTDLESKARLPRLVDLGASKCIPCKMMAPILEELKRSHGEKFEVVFLDVWENPDAARAYNVNLIPTQVFFDASGAERFRHEGFLSKEDILAKWKELGVEP
ncbi:MAG TPA: thioredoxin family protein [Candidatus Hydrogenedentes bacterium]|nr:thioredoxin family protein [Candidatus Hydrogenedentota bacterium]HOS01887.1 thioredoxin family protein [Candidatus Hydrogenedentota bacterium]